MIRQRPNERPKSVGDVKGLIQRHRFEAVNRQKLDALKQIVVPVGSVTDPLALAPPSVVNAVWDGGILKIVLDRPVNSKWIAAIQDMGNFSAVMGYPPTAFTFNGAEARISVRDGAVQEVLDHFKQWLPTATQVLKRNLEREAEQEEYRAKEELRRQREGEETKLRINRALRF